MYEQHVSLLDPQGPTSAALEVAPAAHPLPSREATLHASPTVVPVAAPAPSGGPVDPLARIGALETRVAKLESQLSALATKLGEQLDA